MQQVPLRWQKGKRFIEMLDIILQREDHNRPLAQDNPVHPMSDSLMPLNMTSMHSQCYEVPEQTGYHAMGVACKV